MREWLCERICAELGQEYGTRLWHDMQDSIRLYHFYEGRTQLWQVSPGLDYKPNRTVVNHTKRLIDKVAGFMFGRAPEITLTARDEEQAERVAQLEEHIREVLDRNGWQKRLLNAGKDCFVGKRVALKVAARDGGILLRFRPSIEFYHDVGVDDEEKLDRVIFAFGMNEQKDEASQRIWVQSWKMENGACLLTEGVYNGFGAAIREDYKDAPTGLDGLPVYVILNEGTTGDIMGESDVKPLIGLQEAYNHLTSDDLDALRFNMFPQTVFTDASEESMASVKISPGASIDLQTDPAAQDAKANVTKLESHFNYNERFQSAQATILKDMYKLMSCPQVTEEYLKAVGISGKAMRAMYWDLQCRCEERWAEWDTALKWMVRQIVKQEKASGIADWTDCDYSIRIEHLYPITEDEEQERALDMSEVAAQVRSRRSYMDKWQPNIDADEEIQRINEEKKLLEESW